MWDDLLRKAIAIICFIVLNTFCYAQYNLIPNPSFETYTNCPHWWAELPLAAPWDSPMNTTPDYFNSCDTGFSSGLFIAGIPSNGVGYQYARTGNGYAGILTWGLNNQATPNNWREYLQVPLLDTLIQGEEYFLSFYVSAADSSRYTSNNLGVYFSNVEINDSIFPQTPLPYQPQIQNSISNNLNDRNGWTLVSGNFVAANDEKYLIIGNFDDSSTTVANYTGWSNISSYNYSYLYVDDVFLAPVDSLVSVTEIPSLYNFINIDYHIQITSTNTIDDIEVYDCLGKLLYKNENSKEFIIYYGEFASQFYFVKMLINQKHYSFKFLKP
jgi:OmpA-OmpF porin, OOP family